MTDIDDQIAMTFEEFIRGWNAHDAPAMAACWTDDGGAVDPWGRHAHGRSGVEHLLAGEHYETMKDSTYRVMAIAIRPLSDDAVVAECDAVIDGVRAPNGHPYALPHRIGAVLRRDGGRWRFVSLHPSFAGPRPSP